MKTSFLNKSYIAFFSLLSLSLLFSCKPKDNPVPAPTSSGTLQFHLHTDVDTTEVDSLGQVYTLASGRHISVSFAQLYISNIQLIKLDGTTVPVSGVIVLKRQQIEPYIIGSVPAGNYKSVEYNIGLSPAVNQYSHSSDSVLNQPNMWFDSTGATGAGWGYRFINFQGKIDVTSNGQGPIANMQPFQLKLGGSSAYKQIVMPEQDFTIAPNQVTEVHMIINYAYLFHNIDLTSPANLSIQNPGENTSVQTAIDNNMTAAANASDNPPAAFITYEH